ncbi:hypothetical protein K8942_01355 [Candidatus Peribacteria bacterium]|nr:MAG: hypothetical protein K8942_01355 [Candidatus Peribacteria bacterium]
METTTLPAHGEGWLHVEHWNEDLLTELLRQHRVLHHAQQLNVIAETVPSPWNGTATFNLLQSIRRFNKATFKATDVPVCQDLYADFASYAASTTPRPALVKFYANAYAIASLGAIGWKEPLTGKTLYAEAYSSRSGAHSKHGADALIAAREIEEGDQDGLFAFLFTHQMRLFLAGKEQNNGFLMYGNACTRATDHLTHCKKNGNADAIASAKHELSILGPAHFKALFPGRKLTDCHVNPALL